MFLMVATAAGVGPSPVLGRGRGMGEGAGATYIHASNDCACEGRACNKTNPLITMRLMRQLRV